MLLEIVFAEPALGCISLGTFSSHANRNELITYGSKVNTEKLVLVHGSEVAKNSLKQDLKTAISNEDKTFKVGEKRIFAPTFVYIEEGTAKKLVTGISDKQTTYNAELTNEILDDEAKTFKEFLNN